jgi:hypothetical protein
VHGTVPHCMVKWIYRGGWGLVLALISANVHRFQLIYIQTHFYSKQHLWVGWLARPCQAIRLVRGHAVDSQELQPNFSIHFSQPKGATWKPMSRPCGTIPYSIKTSTCQHVIGPRLLPYQQTCPVTVYHVSYIRCMGIPCVTLVVLTCVTPRLVHM